VFCNPVSDSVRAGGYGGGVCLPNHTYPQKNNIIIQLQILQSYRKNQFVYQFGLAVRASVW